MRIWNTSSSNNNNNNKCLYRRVTNIEAIEEFSLIKKEKKLALKF